MKKILIILLATSFLGGCAGTRLGDFIGTITNASKAAANFAVTQNELDGTRNTYDGTFLASLKSYAIMPRCPKGTSFSISNRCHDRAILKKMRNADAVVDTAFNSTQDQITSGNNAGAVAAYNTLKTAITAAKQILTDNNLIGF